MQMSIGGWGCERREAFFTGIEQVAARVNTFEQKPCKTD